MIFAFDMDKTICTPIGSSQSIVGIREAKPYKYMVNIMKELKSRGHTIKIITHRGKSLCQETEKWLRKNNIPYDAIIYDKPGYDLLIDDKAIPPHNFISTKYVEQYAEFIKGWNFEKGSQSTKEKRNNDV